MSLNLKILIVEDSEDDALLFVRHLRNNGINADWARVAAGEDMEMALESSTWDAILCDHNMPGFGPYAALGLMDAKKLDVPFIVVSGKLPEEHLVELMKAGAHDVVVKSNLARLVPVIRREIKEAGTRKEKRQTEVLLREAIESVDHGFAVFNNEDSLILANSQYKRIYATLDEIIIPGITLERIIREGVARGLFALSGLEADDFVREQIEGHRKAAEPRELQLSDGTWLQAKERRTTCNHVVSVVTDETERKKAEIETVQLAYHDGLTGLANRRQFDDTLKSALIQAQRTGRMVGVMLLDLDKFKYVNDTFGHAVGDEVLKITAERLKDCIRTSDLVARIGGDEFAIVANNIETADGFAILARRILQRLGEPYAIDDKGIFIASSMGVSICPQDSADVEDLIRKADIALYRAKEKAGGTSEFYNLEMDRRVRTTQSLEVELRHALGRSEMELRYQPRLDIRTLEYVAVEALMRWNHPQRGLLLPAEFIPVAEQTALILKLDEWALREACRQAKSWQAAGLPRLVISVNVSPMQLQKPSLADDIEGILHETGLAPELLELEISEQGTLLSGPALNLKLARLRVLGVGIAVHNFGTGYSSLTNMRELPIDTIKIDRSFVQGSDKVWEDAVTCSTVIKLAHGLQLQVVAEGIERGTQLAAVSEQGCDQAQGFYFARPMTPESLVEFLGEGYASRSGAQTPPAASSV